MGMVHLQVGARRLSEINKSDRPLCSIMSRADHGTGMATSSIA